MFRRICFLFLAFSGFVLAQESGAIVGTITDSSGAGVPGAKVTVTETDTHIARTAVSDSKGGYVVPSLRATRYSVAVEAAGFKSFVQNGVILQANQSLTLNAELEVGESRTSVTVSAEGSPVDTSTSTLNQVVDSTRMIDMPLNGRNAASLTTLVAGAVPISGNANGALQTSGISFPSSVAISTNGSRANQMNYQLDGGNNNDGQTNVNQPFPFPMRCRNSAYKPATTPRSTARTPAAWSTWSPSPVPMPSMAMRSSSTATPSSTPAIGRRVRAISSSATSLVARSAGQSSSPTFTTAGTRPFSSAATRARAFAISRTDFLPTLPTPAMIGGDFSALLQANNPGNPLARASRN